MKKYDLENLKAVIADAKTARKKADDALANLRFRIREIEEEVAKIQPDAEN